MSELKAKRAYFSEDEYERGAHKICAKVSDCGYDRKNDWWSYAFEDEVYLKSEADKVIAEKDEEIYNIKYSRDEWAKACDQKDKEIAELQKTNAQLASSCVMLNKLLDTREEEVKTLKAKLEDRVKNYPKVQWLLDKYADKAYPIVEKHDIEAVLTELLDDMDRWKGAYHTMKLNFNNECDSHAADNERNENRIKELTNK